MNNTAETTSHRHEWVRNESHDGIRAWACAECPEASATCGTCQHASGSSLLLCPWCEKRAAAVLDDIAHALSFWQADPRSPMRSPGDMRLVQASGHSAGATTPDDIESRLWSWVARWAEHTGADNAAPLTYLKSRHMWAAHNPDASQWDAYRKAMRTLRASARSIAGLLPERLPEPCVHCGGPVVQDWSDGAWVPLADGLSDVVRCMQCDMTWGDREQWRFVTRMRIGDLPGVQPDALVTIEQARMIWPEVPAATWRWWAKRWRDEGDDLIERALHWWALRVAHRAGRDAWPAWVGADWKGPGEPPSLAGWMPERGETKGMATYRVGDLHALVARRMDERRVGRPARVEQSA